MTAIDDIGRLRELLKEAKLGAGRAEIEAILARMMKSEVYEGGAGTQHSQQTSFGGGNVSATLNAPSAITPGRRESDGPSPDAAAAPTEKRKMLLGESHRLPECACLNCGRDLSAASAISEEAKPSSGDVTICIFCGHLMVFTQDLSFRHPTDVEIRELAGDERLLFAQRARVFATRKNP